MLEMLLLHPVGILFTMKGTRHLFAFLSSSSLTFLLVKDNSEITYPFPLFLTNASHLGPSSHILYILGCFLFS